LTTEPPHQLVAPNDLRAATNHMAAWMQSMAELKAREEELEREWLWLVEALNMSRVLEPNTATQRRSD